MTCNLLQPSIVTVLLALSLGCQQKNEFVAPPPPEVTVSPPQRRDVTVFIGLPGRAQAKDEIEIRARVDGYLQSADFEEGRIVKKDQVLFVIEPEPYVAAVAAAEANLASAKAARDIAGINYDRRKQAYETKAVSEIDLLTAESNLESAKADMQGAEAALTQAQIQLSYTTNRAPATGRISRRLVSVGNLVGGLDATLLATLVVLEPIYVYFNVDERSIIPKLRELGKIDSARLEERPKVSLELANGSPYDHQGVVDFVDNRADPETGTVTARAVFPNPEAGLLPGLYGKILVPERHDAALLVPDLAVQRDIGGNFVLVVNDENVVEARYMEPGAKVDEDRIVESGLEGNERIVVNGIQRARPGMVVIATIAEERPPADAAVVQDQ